MEASETCKVLLKISNQFLEQGNPIQAIKCLQAICLADNQGEYPQLEAEVRLKMAKLMLEYTHNLKEATKALDRANWLLAKMNGYHSLKLAILATLVACYKHSGDRKQVFTACQYGLKIAEQGMDSSERLEFLDWSLHFRTLLADAWAAEGEIEESLSALQAAAALANESHRPEFVAMLLLGALQLYIRVGSPPEVLEATREAAAAIVALEGLPGGAAAGPHLKLHFEVLRAAWLLSRGETIQLQKKEEGSSASTPTTVLQLQQLAKEAAESDAAYHFLPKGCLSALAEVVAAAIWRPTGKFSKAQPHLEAAGEYLAAAEKVLGVRPEDGEEELPPQRRSSAQKLVWIRSLILENQAIIAVTMKELDAGGKRIRELMALVEKFPVLLSQQRGTAHLLAGCYCSETGANDAASSHFLLAKEQSGDPQTQRVSAVEAALSLASSGESRAVLQAMEVLKQSNLFCSSSADNAPPESAAGHFASAQVLLQQGNLNDGRTHIMKALKLAHAPLHNHQLVAKIMCALVPTYMDDDLSAVQSMTNTALSLSKGLYDLRTQIVAAEYTKEWMEKSGLKERIPEQEQYVERKKRLLKEAVDKATARKEQHLKILKWDLGPAEKLPKQRGKKRATSMES